MRQGERLAERRASRAAGYAAPPRAGLRPCLKPPSEARSHSEPAHVPQRSRAGDPALPPLGLFGFPLALLLRIAFPGKQLSTGALPVQWKVPSGKDSATATLEKNPLVGCRPFPRQLRSQGRGVFITRPRPRFPPLLRAPIGEAAQGPREGGRHRPARRDRLGAPRLIRTRSPFPKPS